MLESAKSLAAQLNANSISSGLKSTLEGLQSSALGLGEFLSARIDAVYYNEQRANDSVIAQKVLAIPELLEMILLQGELIDILTMCQVSKWLKSMIEATTALQARLHPDPCGPASNRKMPRQTQFESGLPGFKVNTNASVEYRYAASTTAEFIINKDTSKLPKVGTTWRDMLICQPPVRRMDAFFKCAAHGRTFCSQFIVSSENGLTVGNLYDAAEKICRSRGPFDSSGYSCGLGGDSDRREICRSKRHRRECHVEVEFLAYDE